MLDAIEAFLKNDTLENRENLHDLLQKATLLVPSRTLPRATGAKHFEEGEAIELTVVEAKDKSLAVVAFTDESAFQAWKKEECGYFALPAPTLFSLAMDNGYKTILLNVAGPHRLFLWLPDWIEKEIPLHIALPETPPSEKFLLHVLKTLEKEPAVKSAYLIQFAVEEEPLSETLAIELDEEVEEEQADALFDRVGHTLSHEKDHLQLVRAHSELLQSLQANIPVLYERS